MPAGAPRTDTPITGVSDLKRKVTRVIYLGTDSHVYQAWRPDEGTDPLPAWTLEDLTAASGGSPAAPGTALAACLTGGGGDERAETLRIFYFAADGGLRELSMGCGLDLGVVSLPPTPWTERRVDCPGSVGPDPGSPLAAYHDNGGVAHLAFIDTAGHFRCGPLVKDFGDLTDESGASTPRPGTPLNSYMDRFGQHHLIYLNAEHHVCELLYDGHWSHNDLTANAAWTGARPARADSGLSSSIGVGTGFHYIAYVADDDRPMQLVWHPSDWDDPDENGSWGASGRGQTPAPAAVAGSPIAQIIGIGNSEGYDNERHMAYVEDGSRRFVSVSEKWRFSIGWAKMELSAAGRESLPADRRYEGVPVAGEGTSLYGWWMGAGPEVHVAAVDGDGRLRSFTWSWYNGWRPAATGVIAG